MATTASAIDADRWRSAAHRNMIAHLTGPLAAGAVVAPLAPAVEIETALVRIDWRAREPLVVAAPARSLAAEGLRLTAELVNEIGNKAQPPVDFAPYSEADSFLPLYVPPVSEAGRIAEPFALALRVRRRALDGSETIVPAAEVADLLTIEVIEGVLGRVIYLLGVEQGRLRRQAREVMAMRRLATARDDALDRLGAELSVPRFADRLVVTGGEIATETRREPDAAYRRRLDPYRRFLVPNRRSINDLLNGPGEEAEPNAGLLGELGVTARVRLIEEDNPFAVAIHLVAAGIPALRTNFLQFVRQVHLIWPQNTPQANTVHAGRFLPERQRQRIQELRGRLRASYALGSTDAVAPMLARALDRVGRGRAALGETVPWPIRRTQDGPAGSRYELGLGVDLGPPDAVELQRLADALADTNRPPAADAEIEAMLRSMDPRPPAEDPNGHWLLAGCGLRTVHRIANGDLYVSHLPTFGLTITGPSDAPLGAATQFGVQYHAPGDPGESLVLSQALIAADADWTAAGNPSWTALAPADAVERWDAATSTLPPDAALDLLAAAGLCRVDEDDVDWVVERLNRMPPELIASVELPDALAQRIIAGDDTPDGNGVTASGQLRLLTGLLRAHGLASVLPLLSADDRVILVVGVIGLPLAGVNLSDRRTTGFRWYAIPIQGSGGRVRSIGSRTTFQPDGEGLTALVAIGYARRGETDPYEYRVELPPGALLTVDQYEFLMNLLADTCPIGVEINTFSIRRDHVDLDGDGNAEPLLPAVSRTYRAFRRDRLRGVAGVTIDETP